MTSSTLSVYHRAVELAVKEVAIGPSLIDIAKLCAQTGMFACDAAHRLGLSFDLVIALGFTATFVIITGGSIMAITAVGAIGAMSTEITLTQRKAVAHVGVIGALVMAMGIALTSFTI